MTKAGGLSVNEPGLEDPGIVDLIQSAEEVDGECANLIFDRWLENPPRTELHSCLRNCCSSCNKALIPGRELEWIEVNPGPAEEAGEGPFRSSSSEKKNIYNELKRWRLEVWKRDWWDSWPSYGPKTLVSDCDLENLSNCAGCSIFTIQDVHRHTRLIHWPELGVPLLNALREALMVVHGFDVLAPRDIEDRSAVRPLEDLLSEAGPSAARASSKRQRIGVLQEYESVMRL